MALPTALSAGVMAVALLSQQVAAIPWSQYDGAGSGNNGGGNTLFDSQGSHGGNPGNGGGGGGHGSNPGDWVDPYQGDEGNEGNEGNYDDQANNNEGDEGDEGSGNYMATDAGGGSSSSGGNPKPPHKPKSYTGPAASTVQGAFRSEPIETESDGGDNGDSDGATVSSGSATPDDSGMKTGGYATVYESMGGGGPIAACGVPIDEYVDDNGKTIPFCALNTNSEFKHGANCGRWIRATIGEVCFSGQVTETSACSDGSMQVNDMTGTVLEMYVADMCPDLNFWCQNNPYHIDISQSYIEGKVGMAGFNAPELKWTYLTGPPAGFEQNTLRFIWKESSKYAPNNPGFYATIVVANTPNGLSKVEQKVGGTFKKALKLNELGQQWEMHFPDGVGGPNPDMDFELKPYDADGKCYGVYKVPFNCNGQCGDYTKTTATRIGDC